MNRTRTLVTCTAVALLAAPAAASAETFCVHSPPSCTGVTEAKLQDALDAADANGAGRDTIRLGQGLFNDGPAVNVAGSPVDIIGVASNKTAITSSSISSGQVILDIQEPATAISDLRVHHSTSTTLVTGLKLAGDADNILVTNQSAMGQFDGIQMVGTSASLDSSGVDLSYPDNLQNRAVFVPGAADVTIRDTSLRGVVGVFAGGDVLIQRARIHATQGVVASGGATVQVSDSSIVVPGPLDANFQVVALAAVGNGNTALNADRVTAFANPSGGFGVWVQPNAGAGNNAALDLQGSVLSSFGSDRVAIEGAGASASLSTSWSAYRDGSLAVSGTPTVTEASNNLDLTGVDPGFLDAGPSADLRLAHDSPLIDAGDPAFPPVPIFLLFDVRGLPRKRDGDASGASAVDIGAYEYQRAAPAVEAAFTPPAPLAGENVTLGGTGSDVDGEPLTYGWTFDDGGSATGALVAHAFATPGDHAATVTVTDPAGLTGSATATVPVQAAPGGGPPPDPAPVLTRLRLVPSRFAVARRPRASARRRGGTQVRFTLSESARVALTVQRRRGGRWVRAGRFAVQGKQGANRRRWSGRVRRKALRPGRYRMLATAADAAGQRSARAGARFRVRR